MAVPKRKTSKSKARKRRTHYKTDAPNVSVCPECGEAKMMHQACPDCGSYKGRSVLAEDEE
jgi:large subunit ribosomal protein L32